MSISHKDPMQALAGPGAEAFKLWISFFPVAPVFGVKWIFAEAMPGYMAAGFGMAPGAPAAPAPAAAPVAHERVSGQPDADTAAAQAVAGEVIAAAQAEAQAALDALAALDEASLAFGAAPAEEAAETAEETAEEAGEAVMELGEAVSAAAPAELELPFGAAAGARPSIHPPATLYHVPPAEVDDLKQIKGIGPGLETRLNALGIYRFDQIAGFSTRDLEWVDENMTTFKGRCFRDDWVGQARALLG